MNFKEFAMTCENLMDKIQRKMMTVQTQPKHETISNFDNISTTEKFAEAGNL
jgi:hypothetical protein